MAFIHSGTAPDTSRSRAELAGRRARASRSSRKLGVVMSIMRVSDPTFEAKDKRSDSRVFVRFRVNRAPDQSWIATFKGHASSSVLRAAHAVFNGTDVNLGLRTWGGVERSPASSGILRRV